MASYQHISHGFDPVFDERSRILVLGSFPSVLSRKNAFYYGNPQNRFWRMMAACLGRPVPPNEGQRRQSETVAPTNPSTRAFATSGSGDSEPVTLEESIAAKKRLLLDGGIALWDVIESCDIKGSSDASIKNVVPAQVGRVLEAAHIGAVVCNGATAGRLYKRYLQWEVGLAAHVLPSTSPANAAWGAERLAQRWREELAPLLAAAADGTLGEAPSPSSVKRSFVTVKAQVAGASSKAGTATAGGSGHGTGHAGDAVADPRGDGSESTPSPSPAASAAGSGKVPEPRVEFATVRVESPAASSWSVHKSMQGNKRANTKPELLVRERLRAAGLGGYRLQWKVPGHPDIAWPGKRVAIEVRGCFWHRCPHCNPSTPKKNVEYWEAKFARNAERDADNLRQLQEMGWRVHIIWECQLKKRAIDATMEKLLPELADELGKQLRPQPIAEANEHATQPASKAGAAQPAGNIEATAQSANTAAAGTQLAGNASSEGKVAAERLPEAASEGAPDESTATQPHFMYVIECADGSLYTGYTTDVAARFARHQAGTGAKYTRGRGPLNLLAVAEFATKHDAMSAEYRFKRLTRDQKDDLLAKAAKPNADFADVLQEAFTS